MQSRRGRSMSRQNLQMMGEAGKLLAVTFASCRNCSKIRRYRNLEVGKVHRVSVIRSFFLMCGSYHHG